MSPSRGGGRHGEQHGGGSGAGYARLPAAGAPGGAGSGVRTSPVVMDLSKQCSVRLQVLLYFSFWYDVLFAVLLILAAWVKVRWIQGPVIWALFSVNLCIAFVMEPCRLYVGYAGNLRERVPELFLFVFLCFVCSVVLAAELVLCTQLPELSPKECSSAPGRHCVLPIEKSCWIGRIVLLIGEQVWGMQALRSLIKEKSARFFASLRASAGFATEHEGADDDDAEIRRNLGALGSASGTGMGGRAPGSQRSAAARAGTQPGVWAGPGIADSAAGSPAPQIYGHPQLSPSPAPQTYGHPQFSPAGWRARRPRTD